MECKVAGTHEHLADRWQQSREKIIADGGEVVLEGERVGLSCGVRGGGWGGFGGQRMCIVWNEQGMDTFPRKGCWHWLAPAYARMTDSR